MRILNHRRNVIAAALLLLPSALQAAPPEKPAAAPKGKLDIRLLVTAEPNKVFRPVKGPDGKAALAEPVKVVPKGQQIAAVIFFKDCQPDAAGNCNVEIDLKGVNPQGVAFKDRKGADLWRNRRAPDPSVTQLGSSYMRLQFEPKDAVGTYRIIAVAHDRNSGTDARAEASFEVK